jgi:Exportin 1-like protein
MEVKDAMRVSCMADLIGACQELVAACQVSQPALAAALLEALRRFVNWADINLIATEKCAPCFPQSMPLAS